MKTPKRLEPLVADGLIDEVLHPLMSGKEAQVYVVRSAGELRCAKVYKEANRRGFRRSVEYTEGRKVRNSRRARAMEKGARYGRKAQEEAWQSAEVDALYRLSGAGVRVPRPYHFVDGVLLMELVTGADGDIAPRLSEVVLTEEESSASHGLLIRQVVRMLCAGLVHGDLSEYNILIGADGPVIIDLPQAVDAAGNNRAFAILERDITNLAAYFGRFAPRLLTTDYAMEMWTHYQNGRLHPELALTGHFQRSEKAADVEGVMREVDAAIQEQAARKRNTRQLEQ